MDILLIVGVVLVIGAAVAAPLIQPTRAHWLLAGAVVGTMVVVLLLSRGGALVAR